jgi:hypothetical protein
MLSFQTLIEWVILGIEVLAIVIMVAFISVGTVRWLLQSRKQFEHAYKSYRILLGKSLLVGLELLVAADIITHRNLGIDADEPCDSGAPRAGQDGLGLGAYLGSRGPLALAG